MPLTAQLQDVNQQQRTQEAKVEDKIRRFLCGRGETADAVLFATHLEDAARSKYGSLKSSSDLLNVGRNQGYIQALEWVLSLKEEK